MDCGPTCLKMVSAHYGKNFSIQFLREICDINYHGVSVAGIENAAKAIGLKTIAAQLPFDALINKAPLPCILHWNRKHFVVLFKASKKFLWVADPAMQKVIRYRHQTFLSHWGDDSMGGQGVALFLEPTADFDKIVSNETPTIPLISLFEHVRNYKGSIAKIVASLVLGSSFSLLIPLLTQAIVDKGINGKNPGLLALICLGQLLLFLGKLGADFIRSRLLFKLGMKVSLGLVTDFLSKLMKLRFSFFDTRTAGDNIQRLSDNQRIEDFLTNHSINALLSSTSILIYGGVLCYYNWKIFLFYITGSLIGIIWNYSFKERRRIFDQRKFQLFSANQQMQMEMFSAMKEIRLTGSEVEKNERWTKLQEELYSMKKDNLKLDQYIQGVSLFINESKNIITTYFAATLVLNGHLTLGAMLAITYIYGALNGPIIQLADFIRASQDTRFSLQRIAEVQFEPDEDQNNHSELRDQEITDASIELTNLNFRYGGSSSPFVLNDVSLVIPPGKVTAIVGMSGSGKTTLVKLLLKFYSPTSGEITVGGKNLNDMNACSWRKHCGVVMQESHIFSDTIAGNIWIGSDRKDTDDLIHAAKLANFHAFVLTLPFGYDTIVGKDGIGLSEGQKQRLLIARLIYRQPKFILMDEATNSLDANNERLITDNLKTFFTGRTVVIVAHRLSTVSHADQIVVLDNGNLIERGSHRDLTMKKGAYYNLVKNQLELGK